MDTNDIYSYVRIAEARYRIGNTKIAKYVDFSHSETVQRIYAYLNSKHISGEQDSLGRDKPFYNIVIAARNIWFRATDLDRKNIIIRETDSSHVISAYIATIKLQDWMRRERFGVFLNQWGLELAGFGSAVSKWVKKNGKLIPAVVPWSQLICDTIDFESNPVIEIFEFTPAQLRQKKEYNQDMVESLINAKMARMLVTGEIQDIKPDYIKIFEVHGMFPKSFLTDNDADKHEYTQQMHVVSYVRTQNAKQEYQNFSLYRGREAKSPYRLSHLIKEDGRTLGIGSVENLFNPQWMVNHNVKNIKDANDLGGKIILQTSDPTFTGANALTSIETGQILLHKAQEPITVLDNEARGIPLMEADRDSWKAQGGEVNGITDAMAGVNVRGASWRIQSLQVQQAQYLFDLMKQNKGLAIEDMLREDIIPFIKENELKDTKQIVATLEAHDIKKIDSIYVPQEAVRRFNKKVIDHVLKNGSRPIDINLQNEVAQVQAEQSQQGNTRYFKPSDIDGKTWKEIFKDLEWNVEVDITGEASDTAAMLQTLNTALQIVVNPAYANNPQAQMIVSKILLATGAISPLEMTTTPASNPATPVANPPNSAGQVGATNALSALGNKQ